MNSTVQDALNELIHDTFNCEDYSAGLRKWGHSQKGMSR